MTIKGPLQGIRIMDFGWVMAGPRATKALADLGAEVIRIEGRQRLDSFRKLSRLVNGRETTPGGCYKENNRGKMAITLNMRHPKGIDIATQLLRISDAVVENFSAGVMERWGFGYDYMQSVNPRIIYISMGGFGHSGPYKNYISHGMLIQALCGFTHLTGFPDMAPVGMGAYSDFISGAAGALALLAALEHRRRTGEGQHIDLAQFQSMTAMLGPFILDYTFNHRSSQRVGVGNPFQPVAPYGTYRCAGEDRWCVINVFTDDQWDAFCQVLGNPAWASEPAFLTMARRVEHRAQLDRHVTEWTCQRTPEEVMYLLQKAGVPAAVVQDAADVARDPHLHARGFWEYHQDPDLGIETFEGIPEKLSETPGHVWGPAPQVGEHNDYVYGTLLGMSAEQIQQYSEEGIF